MVGDPGRRGLGWGLIGWGDGVWGGGYGGGLGMGVVWGGLGLVGGLRLRGSGVGGL